MINSKFVLSTKEAAMRRLWASTLVLIGFATTSFAHYNMLLPDKAWATKGDKITFTYQFGHPFEHELFDAPEPRAVFGILPDGKTQKIEKLNKIALRGADGKKVTAFRFAYEPAMRGDHTVILQTPPIWMEESKDFVQDTVKAVLHVQTQKNWDADPRRDQLLGSKLKMIPQTRPYGLLPGMVFQARVWKESPAGSSSLPQFGPHDGTQVEIERYNPAEMKDPPPDELVTFKTKTDPNGIFTFAFPQPGWWCMTAARQEPGRQWKEGGTEGPVRERTTLWIHVDEKK
jgi:cobalt/nickel transport protein